MAFRESVKEKLKEMILRGPFEQSSENVLTSKGFYNQRYAKTVTVTLKPTYFEKYVKCWSAADGWTKNKYQYTYDNVKNFFKLS